MMKPYRIPFLKPDLVKLAQYVDRIREMERSGIYSNYGPLNTRFEDQVRRLCYGGDGAVTTVNNATTGLILAISEAKRSGGKYALMPSFTFAATPLAAVWCGLTPYFVDIGERDWCMDPGLVRQCLELLGPETAVVVPYAAFGTAMDLRFYRQLQESGIPVVVDAAPGFGTREQDGGWYGRGFPGTIVFSFHATKTFGIGEGGLLYSDSAETIRRLRQSGNFGFGADRTSTRIGLNAKLPEWAAGVALATLAEYERKHSLRRRIYEEYLERMQHLELFGRGWRMQDLTGDAAHPFFPALCPEDITNQDVIARLESAGIEARTYFAPPCHQQPLFHGAPTTSLAVTERICRRIVSLPLWEGMQPKQIRAIAEVLATL